MIVSEKRREANRLNAQKSTGPKSQEGKDRSRENAIKHGLASLVVVTEDAAMIQARASECFFALKPKDRFQADLVTQVAILQIRTEHTQRVERNLRQRAVLRALTSWDEDRRLDAESIAAGLAKRPGESVALLRRTPQGCDLLIGYWAMLARAAKLAGGWDDEARALAFDLLGTPRGVRVGNPGAIIDEDGSEIDEGKEPAAVARSQIADLRLAREAAAEHDAIDRALAEADLTDRPDPEIRNLRRYETALHRRLRWTLERLKDPISTHRVDLNLRPDFCAAPAQTEAEYEAEVQAEMDEKAEKDAKFEAEYYARKAKQQAEEQARAEAKARRSEKALARKQNKAIIAAPNEPTAPAPNEPIIQAPNEPIIEPVASSTPVEPASERVEGRLHQAEVRREAKRRKLERLRA